MDKKYRKMSTKELEKEQKRIELGLKLMKLEIYRCNKHKKIEEEVKEKKVKSYGDPIVELY
jgi:hypothetical protein